MAAKARAVRLGKVARTVKVGKKGGKATRGKATGGKVASGNPSPTHKQGMNRDLPSGFWYLHRWIPLHWGKGTDLGQWRKDFICVDSTEPLPEMLVSLFHEFIHEVSYRLGLSAHFQQLAGGKDESGNTPVEEHVADVVSMSLYLLLRDNPSLAEWIMDMVELCRGEMEKQDV